MGVHGDVGLETALPVTGSKQSFGDALQRLDCPLQRGLFLGSTLKREDTQISQVKNPIHLFIIWTAGKGGVESIP